MQFGWLTLALSPSPEEDAVRIEQQIEQVCCAEALGFSDVWLTEHYFTGESVYNDSLMFAAALAMRTSRIRLGFAVVQTPFHHPCASPPAPLLDNLSKGRIDVGVGKGTIYNEYEFVGTAAQRRQPRAHGGAIEIVERAWAASLRIRGQVPHGEGAGAAPKPVQPKPPLWRSVISPGSFSECGRLGIPILTPPAGAAHPRTLGALRGGTEGAAMTRDAHPPARAECAMAQRLRGGV